MYVLGTDVVGWLVLGDLHTGAHITLAMQEEGKRTRQVLAGEKKRKVLQIHSHTFKQIFKIYFLSADEKKIFSSIHACRHRKLVPKTSCLMFTTSKIKLYV